MFSAPTSIAPQPLQFCVKYYNENIKLKTVAFKMANLYVVSGPSFF